MSYRPRYYRTVLTGLLLALAGLAILSAVLMPGTPTTRPARHKVGIGGTAKSGDDILPFDEPRISDHWPRLATHGFNPPFIELVRAKVPVGVSIEDARRFMQEEGFKCDYDDEKGGSMRWSLATEYSCLVSQVWWVVISMHDGKVTAIHGDVGLEGP